MSFKTDERENLNSKYHHLPIKCFMVLFTLCFVCSCCIVIMLFKIYTLHNEVAQLKHNMNNISSLLHRHSLRESPNALFNQSDDESDNEYVVDTRLNPLTRKIRSPLDFNENETSSNAPMALKQKNKRRQEKSTDLNIQEDSPSGLEIKRHRQRHRGRLELAEEITFPTKQYDKGKSLIAHFSGDTSKYVMGQHSNFNGNGHLQHPVKTYVDWVGSDWVQTLGMDQFFRVNNGYMTIKEAGLYLIYAQIYYLDAHDTNGYKVYVNGNAILQCTTMTHSVSRIVKGNTCYTSGVEYIHDGDLLSIEDLADGRYSLFEKGKSFFGIIKLSDLKLK